MSSYYMGKISQDKTTWSSQQKKKKKKARKNIEHPLELKNRGTSSA